MARMRWDQLPARATVSMSKGDVEKLRGSGTGTFVTGMMTGAALVLMAQGCNVAEVKDDTPVAPSPVVSTSNKN